jgi:oxygen-independent coproporphyrinogen III oxidase
MKQYRGLFGTFDTLYIGGGTPSLLRPKELEYVFTGVHDHFDLSPESEVTLEANPADLKPDYLRVLRDMGVSRLNIGVQSFYQPTLNFLGRRHGVQESRTAIDRARKAGFENLGLDLIYGAPGMEIDRWIDTLMTALFFEPEHLSCYQLSISSEAPLGKTLHEGGFSLPDEDMSLRFFVETSEILEAAGYVHYEVSNYARDISLVSIHNQKYWDHSPYLGLGPGAHSFLNKERWWNHRSITRYAGDLEVGRKPIEGRELLSPEDLILESLFLGLRTRKGIDLMEFRETNNLDLEKEKRETLQRLEAGGFIVVRDGRLSPTLRGYAMADSLPLSL